MTEVVETADPVESPDRVAARRLDRVLTVATWAAVVIGVALRVRQWAFARSFWLDEVQLLDAITGRSFGGLLLPLQQNQTAPPGWLWAEHATPVVLAAVLARRVLGAAGGLAVTVLMAGAPLLVHFSNEVKQYSADLFCTVLLLLGVVLLLERATIRRYLTFGAVAAVAAWFSHASLLVTAAGLLALALPVLARRDWRGLATGPVVAGAVWLVSVGVEYAVSLRRVSTDSVLQTYWKDGFPPQPATPAGVARWIGPDLSRLLDRPLDLEPGWLVVATLLIGTAALALRRPLALAVLGLPLLATVAAAIVGAYPVADRLVLFWVPLVFTLLAGGLVLLGGPGDRRVALVTSALTVAALAVLAAPNLTTSAREAASPYRLEETRQVLGYVAAHRRPGDAVVVDPGGVQQVAFYAPRVGLTGVNRIRLALPSRTCRLGAAQVVLRRDATRVWVVFGHQFSWFPKDTRERFRAHFATIGSHVERVVEPGVEADLYDLRRPPDDPGRADPRLRLNGAQCLGLTAGLPTTF